MAHLIKNEIFIWHTPPESFVFTLSAHLESQVRGLGSHTNAITHRILIGCCTGLSQSVYSLTIVANISFKWNVYVLRT